MHSPFVKQMLNSWSVCGKIILKDWIELFQALLETASQLQWSSWFRKEAKTVEKWSKDRSIEIFQDQILGEGNYVIVERQSPYDGHILALCPAAAFNAWERIEEIGKKIKSFTKVIQGPKEPFIDFF